MIDIMEAISSMSVRPPGDRAGEGFGVAGRRADGGAGSALHDGLFGVRRAGVRDPPAAP